MLHYLKCTNTEWKRIIEESCKKSEPKYKFKVKLGSRGTNAGQFLNIHFITTGRQDNINVSDHYQRIQIFDSNRQWKQSIGSYGSDDGQFNCPTGVLFNSESHMIVADYTNHRI